ncbi:MAG: hypothetical protein ACXWPM_03185 [Bdellovibrionota bacterium]
MERPAQGYPVLAQVLFGLSFVAFLIFNDRIHSQKIGITAWCLIQFALGVWLIRGRMRARRRISRCIRCGVDVP